MILCFSFSRRRIFAKYLERLIAFLLPLYNEEGKIALVIVGCNRRPAPQCSGHAGISGGLSAAKGYQATESHRDMTRA